MPNWFHCDNASGAISAGGISSSQDAPKQTAPEGQTLYVVPDGMIGSPFSAQPDFSLLKGHLRSTVDEQAGAARKDIITDVPGQAQTYGAKAAEAQAWVDGADAAGFPYLSAEAEARGVTMAQVRDEIIAQLGAQTPILARIEANRIRAKRDIDSASTLPSILSAGQVDWPAIISAMSGETDA